MWPSIWRNARVATLIMIGGTDYVPYVPYLVRKFQRKLATFPTSWPLSIGNVWIYLSLLVETIYTFLWCFSSTSLFDTVCILRCVTDPFNRRSTCSPFTLITLLKVMSQQHTVQEWFTPVYTISRHSPLSTHIFNPFLFIFCAFIHTRARGQ